MSGYMIRDRRGAKTVSALEVENQLVAQQLATMPLGAVDSRLDPYREPEPESGAAKDVPFNLKLKGLELHFGEFLRHHSNAADSENWKDEFKRLLPGVVGDASVLTMGDIPVATFRRDTKLAQKRLEKEQPHIIAKYTKRKWVEYFDVDTFRVEMPDMYHAYRGRSFRLVKSGPGAGLVLPGN